MRREGTDAWHRAPSSGSTTPRDMAHSGRERGRCLRPLQRHPGPRLQEPGGGRPRQKNSPDGACGSFCRAAPLVRRAGPSGPVVPGPSRATYDYVCLGLGGDHLTAHRRGTHRLDHLPFSARPEEGPRNPQPWIGRRLPTRGSVTLSPAELPERTPREPVCALTDFRSCYYRDPAEQSKMILTSRKSGRRSSRARPWRPARRPWRDPAAA